MSPTAALGQWGRELFTVEEALSAWTLLSDTVNLIDRSQSRLAQCWFGRAGTFEVRAPCSDRSGAEAQLQRESPRGPVSHAGDSQEGRTRTSRALETQLMVQATLEFDLSCSAPASVCFGVNSSSRIIPSLPELPVPPVIPSEAGLHPSVDSRSVRVETHWSMGRALRGQTLIHITWRPAWFACTISHVYKVFKWPDRRAGIVSEHHSVSKVCGVVARIVCPAYILHLWIFITVIIAFVMQLYVCVCANQIASTE